MRTAGFINPNIFALKGLEYRIRFCRAPRLVGSREALRRDHVFNSYLLRGEYDLALVSVESSQLLFKALLEKRLDDFSLCDVATFTVRKFLKYHGCVVTPIRSEANPAEYPPDTFHHLFNLTKDWHSAPESWRAALLRDNLLMVNAAGQPCETEDLSSDGVTRAGRRTIVRVGFHSLPDHAAPPGFDEYLSEQIVPNPLVRSCYTAKAPSRGAYVMELVGDPGQIDAFVADFHDDCARRFVDVSPVVRCDDVVTKLAEGHLNVLLTIQAKPEAMARAEDGLFRSLFEEDRSGIMRFVDESEEIIRSIRAERLQSRCLSMLSTMQLGFHRDSPAALRDALHAVGRELVALMVERLATTIGCAPDQEAVVGELKRRKLFRDHTATIGNLSPAFLALCHPLGDDVSADGERAFGAFLDLSNRLMLSGHAVARVNLEPADRADAEEVFCQMMRVIPAYFS